MLGSYSQKGNENYKDLARAVINQGIKDAQGKNLRVDRQKSAETTQREAQYFIKNLGRSIWADILDLKKGDLIEIREAAGL